VDDPHRGDLTVTVLGCSGTYAGPDSACSGYLVRSPGATVVVDLGAGTLANLQRHVGLEEVDALVLSHEHPDHWLDLPLLRNALRYMLDLGDLPVYGTAGTRVLVDALIDELEPTLLWHTITDGSAFTVGDLEVRCSRTDHPVETLAMRIDRAGRSLLYSADTGPRWQGGDLAGGVDVLLCEASFTPENEGRHQHLSARQAASLAASVAAERLVLTHVPPGVDADGQRRLAAAEHAGPVSVADTGATFTV
jgi:ribonuclease BN (tRNA processing enzyme)